MKKKRHEVILRIIETNSIFTQTELLEKLSEMGFNTTQATISRDIKALRLVKKPDEFGRSCYAAEKDEKSDFLMQYKSVFAHSVISIDYASNIVVIKCNNGMANAACAALDVMEFEGVVGTLAGDDTIFILTRSEASAKQLISMLESQIWG